MNGATGINMKSIVAVASAAPGQVHERTDDSAPNSGCRGGGGCGRGAVPEVVKAEAVEVGIALRGTEVKRLVKAELRVFDSDILSHTQNPSRSPFKPSPMNILSPGEFFQHKERRPTDRLLHKGEARKLLQKTDRQPGMTVVPLKAYWSDQNKVKFEMGLCRGKDLRDKRDDIQKREGKREADRMIKNFNFDSTNTLTIKDYSLWMVHSKAL
ncbi:hypothetical protein HJC23_006782 [Cyclotella cryptica]|uniref:Calmodulin n=1 Tax=Cyclotella cryptica TaxID=29204 RepID=A0ABD3NZI7_9STRA